MTFDLIIPTYNRVEKCLELVSQFLEYSFTDERLNKIIIIDSSDSINDTSFPNSDKILYIHTKHKNQPYQRYLGYTTSEADYLLYLDDDMEIADKNILKQTITLLGNNIQGIGFNFEEKNSKSYFKNIERSITKDLNVKYKTSTIYIKLRYFVAYPLLENGKVWWNGVKGTQSKNLNSTQFFSGGAFIVERKNLYKNFDFRLFDLYEIRLGKGEDTVLSYNFSRNNHLVYQDKICFYHNDQNNSTYTNNNIKFAERTIFSRLFLSIVYANLNNKSSFFTFFIYHWYSLMRLISQILMLMIKPSSKKLNLLFGFIKGWFKSFFIRLYMKKHAFEYWNTEVNNELRAK